MPASVQQPKSPARYLFRALLFLCLVLVIVLGIEHWRGERILRNWRTQTADLVPQKLWPPFSEASRQYYVQLNLAAARLGAPLAAYAGMIQPIVDSGFGMARRGSQELAPVDGKTWEALDQAVRQNALALRDLRQLMNEIPSGIDYDINESLAKSLPARYVAARTASQTLHAAALSELHQGNLTNALDYLLALAHAPKMRAKDPSLVSYMIRIALVGLVDAACWDALQAEGWTDRQLEALQKACQDAPQISQLPQVYRAEQAAHLHDIQWFRSHLYGKWFARSEDIFASFGVNRVTMRGPMAAYHWNQFVRHPAWTVAFGDTEPELTALATAVRRSSWLALRDNLADVRARYHRPEAPWRFYLELPLQHVLSGAPDSVRPNDAWPYPDFYRTWQAAFRNLTQHNLLVAAIALKRYQLRNDSLPPTLSSLCPEFLDAVPLDLMDGQHLRYYPNLDDSFTLYSVGLDGRDDGGDPESPNPSQRDQFNSLNGKDIVWPRLDPNLF
ncbi:MAG: hypothetical protein JWM16_816 [Verrucomicrobiales bacterium]|nr:hypothetical protein [Verrucomicrobiales bacterium]